MVICRKFASLEPVDVGRVITGVTSDTDHKLGVSVVEADKISNSVVKQEVINRMEKTITATVREKLGLPPAKPKQKSHHQYTTRIF